MNTNDRTINDAEQGERPVKGAAGRLWGDFG